MTITDYISCFLALLSAFSLMLSIFPTSISEFYFSSVREVDGGEKDSNSLLSTEASIYNELLKELSVEQRDRLGICKCYDPLSCWHVSWRERVSLSNTGTVSDATNLLKAKLDQVRMRAGENKYVDYIVPLPSENETISIINKNMSIPIHLTHKMKEKKERILELQTYIEENKQILKTEQWQRYEKTTRELSRFEKNLLEGISIESVFSHSADQLIVKLNQTCQLIEDAALHELQKRAKVIQERG
jgi:hypothetical protein